MYTLVKPFIITRECCLNAVFCEDIAFEGEKLTIQKAKTFVYLFLFFARMHVGGKIYHLAIHIINNVPV